MLTISSGASASLAWAAGYLAQQPESVRVAYEQAAEAVVQALSQPAYSAAISIPFDHPSRVFLVRAGTIVHRLLKKSCSPALLRQLQTLSSHARRDVRESARLTCYLAGERALEELPDERALRAHYTAFDRQGHLLTPHLHAAASVVEALARQVDLLHHIEALYPAWATDDRFSEEHGRLTTHLVEQGRALANRQTEQVIQSILTAWKSGELTRGLTIFLPFLDERLYRMQEYRIVVIPAGRILFRPEFVIGACRVAQRRVRADPNFSQATRWQLLSQLDTVQQAFEASSHFPP